MFFIFTRDDIWKPVNLSIMLLRPSKEIFLKSALCIFARKRVNHMTISLKDFLPVREVGVRATLKDSISNKTDFLNKQTFSACKVGVKRSLHQPYLSVGCPKLRRSLRNTNMSSTLFKRVGSFSVSCGRHLCTKTNSANIRLGCTIKNRFLFPGFSHVSIWKRGSSLKRNDNRGVDHRILYLVYGSCAIGAILISSIAFTYLRNLYKRFAYGIHTFYDPPFGRRQKLIKYKDVILPAMLEKKLKEIRKFTVRADDVWVISWPRSGTTWVQEIVYLIQTNLDLDLEAVKNIEQRFAFLENAYPGLKTMEEMRSPRLIKSHLPFHLLPEQMETVRPKVIYVVRNPKDILISYYSFLKMLTPLKFEGTFEEFCDRFTKDKVYYSPWGKHVRGAWELEKEGANVLIVKYEDLHKDLAANIERIASFLNKKLSREQMAAICHHCQFQNMRQNNSVNYSWWDDYGIRDKTQSQFLRKGQVGDWKNHITAFISRRIEKMVQDNLSDTDLVFDYELATKLEDNQEHV